MLLVTYDLNRPGQNYQRLYQAIQSLGDWCHELDSTWLVKSRLTAEQALNYLLPFIDRNDRLIVTVFNPRSSSGFLSQDALNWINS